MDIQIEYENRSRNENTGCTTTAAILVVNGTKVSVIHRSAGNNLSEEVNVKVCNASGQVWRGMGRFFPSFEEAIKGYKSQKSKTAIEYVRGLV